MEGDDRGVRLRAFLGNYAAAVVGVALVLALAGGYLTYAAHYTEPDTRTETSLTTSWRSSGQFTHSATVINGTDVYDSGDRLENRTGYFRTVTPRLNGSFVYSYSAESGDLTAGASVVLVLQSVEESEEGPEVEYWRTESTLATRSVGSLSPGDSLRVPFSLNVNQTANRLAAIDEQFGGTPGQREMFVEIRLQRSGTRGGQSVDGTRTYRLPISASDSIYRVQDPGLVTDSGNRTQRTTTTVEPGPLQRYGGPALLVVGLIGLVGIVAGRYGGYLTVSEREREWLAYRSEQDEFDDWITVVRLSEDDYPASTAEADTLEGLVDIAIDSDRRVLEDAERNRFVVFATDRAYVYNPPSPPEHGLLPTDDAVGTGSASDVTDSESADDETDE